MDPEGSSRAEDVLIALRSQSADLHTEQFLEAMEAYKASMKDPNMSILNLREKHSWSDVLRVAEHAEAIYTQAGKKGLRKVGRVIASKSEAALPLVRLIPNENYLSVLCGGLKIVFEVRPEHDLKLT